MIVVVRALPYKLPMINYKEIFSYIIMAIATIFLGIYSMVNDLLTSKDQLEFSWIPTYILLGVILANVGCIIAVQIIKAL